MYCKLFQYNRKKAVAKHSVGFQYFSSVQVLYYNMRYFLLIMNILYNTLLKFGGTNYHFKYVKIPDITPYKKACKQCNSMSHMLNEFYIDITMKIVPKSEQYILYETWTSKSISYKISVPSYRTSWKKFPRTYCSI